KAAHHLKESVRLHPHFADAFTALGSLYKRLERLGEAASAYRSAIELDPQSVKAQYGLAQLYQAQGKMTEARPFFRAVQELKDQQKHTERAAERNARGLELMNAGKASEALHEFDEALLLDPTLAPAVYNKGLALARLGSTAETIEAFRLAIRLRPGFVMAHYGLALALQAAGDPSSSEQLRKARSLKEILPSPDATSADPILRRP
ncbi:MAG: tetratricopeptide repeat protein, partial [Acidobacteria bacterium]|nr:tetratricopeptide repeat protein [Acidobacteriota bacterium]